MMEMLGANDVVTLDASALEAIDLTFLQLVHALRTDAAAQGKQVALSAPANPHLSAILTRAGFAPGASPSDDDFWFQGVLPQ
ncbi:MAG: hypothetical protein B7Y36_15255 [Novosphingobium sp. 28-62-57]|nr:MAG: hypothetical protein B7Z36_00390 [Novosphingobium sp. 12-63-9]OYZ08912.1 MAG: hypothetical protein B7Y36_15255 [Novosphingobium sp. 28-62-57]OZA38056.1 MAG: hypothetical protein B7X92_04030 [Novosphingobium sp. 17-62-9]